MRAVVGATAVALVITGCAGASSASSPSRAGAPSAAAPTTRVLATTATQAADAGPCGRGGSAAQYSRVIWIWMENRSFSQIIGPHGHAPRLASYSRRCGVATSYFALRHPSLPNYLGAVSGSTGGVTSDCSPTGCPQRRPTIFRQLSERERQWRSLAEGMHTACDRASYGRYAARHNPAVYFPGVRDKCLKWDLAMGGAPGRFATMLKHQTLKEFPFIPADLCQDGHDCSRATADAWLGPWLDR